MELNIKLTDEEIKEAVLAIVAKRIAEECRCSTQTVYNYCLSLFLRTIFLPASPI